MSCITDQTFDILRQWKKNRDRTNLMLFSLTKTVPFKSKTSADLEYITLLYLAVNVSHSSLLPSNVSGLSLTTNFRSLNNICSVMMNV